MQFTNIGYDEEGQRIGNCTDCGANGVLTVTHSCHPSLWDGKRIHLDWLNGIERETLVMGYLKSDPLQMLGLAAITAFRKKGVRKKTILEEIQQHPEFLTFWRIVESMTEAGSDVLEGKTKQDWLDAIEKRMVK